MDIKKWLKEIFSSNREAAELLPTPPDRETLERLIEKTINQTSINHERKDSEDSLMDLPTEADLEATDGNSEDGGRSQTADNRQGCCPYGVKRNIVASIAEIRRFADEHKLTTEILKALLKILAEIAANALKGKVSAGALMMLLNALNFESAKESAYKEGEKAGRNAKIEEEYFPATDDGIPHFNGINRHSGKKREDIFSLAREA